MLRAGAFGEQLALLGGGARFGVPLLETLKVPS
jgi:hypothetical protein